MNLVAFISNWCCPFSNRGAITQSVRGFGWHHCCRNSLLNISESSAMRGSLAIYFDSCDSCDWTGDIFVCRIYLRGTLIYVKYRLYERWFFDFWKGKAEFNIFSRTPVIQGNVAKWPQIFLKRIMLPGMFSRNRCHGRHWQASWKRVRADVLLHDRPAPEVESVGQVCRAGDPFATSSCTHE